MNSLSYQVIDMNPTSDSMTAVESIREKFNELVGSYFRTIVRERVTVRKTHKMWSTTMLSISKIARNSEIEEEEVKDAESVKLVKNVLLKTTTDIHCFSSTFLIIYIVS